jgi:MFS family permease
MRPALRPLTLPWYRALLGGYAISSIGTWVGEIALALLVLERTGSAAAVAAVLLAAQVLPAAVAPALVARAERLRSALPLLLLAEGVLFAVIAALAWAPLWVLLVLVAVDGLAALIARALLKASIVATTRPSGLLAEANALFVLVFTVCGLAGPALGGLLVAVADPRTALLADAASFVLAAGVLATRQRHAPRLAGAGDADHLRGQLAAIIRHLRHHATLRPLVTANTIASVFFAATVPVEAALVTQTLGAGDGAFGLVLTVWGAGMVVGGALLTPLRRLQPGLLVAGAFATIALAYLGVGVAASLPAVLGWSALAGAANAVEAFAIATVIQEATDDALQGRLAALVESLVLAATGLGFALGGVLAAVASPRVAYLVAATGALAVVVRLWPVIAPLRWAGAPAAER